VEETLNKLLDAEADQLCGAGRYERSPDRIDTRAGSYERSLETKAGKVKLKIPKLRTIPFESAIIDRYKRRECSVEEALIEMYLAGVSIRRVEDISEALWGTRASAGLSSKLNKQVYDKIETWRNRMIEGRPKRIHQCPLDESKRYGGDAQSDSCPGRPSGGPREGAGSGGEIQGYKISNRGKND
jgi:transposase-like protein